MEERREGFISPTTITGRVQGIGHHLSKKSTKLITNDSTVTKRTNEGWCPPGHRSLIDPMFSGHGPEFHPVSKDSIVRLHSEVDSGVRTNQKKRVNGVQERGLS